MRKLALLAFVVLAACGGGGGGDDTGDDTATPPTAYRADQVELMDPHLFALNGALDVTDTVNSSIATAIGEDGDSPPDGKLDLSLVMVFRPVDLAAASGRADVVLTANCTAPVTTTECSADADSTVVQTTATNGDSACLTVDAATTGGYDPAITVPAGPCFATDMHDVTITASGVDLALTDSRIAADWGATGAPDRLENGLLVGFMSETTAQQTTIPDSTPIVGGEMLSTLLQDSDKDTGPGGESGWYFYFNFSAGVVTFNE
jgi:hypothetical protein